MPLTGSQVRADLHRKMFNNLQMAVYHNIKSFFFFFLMQYTYFREYCRYHHYSCSTVKLLNTGTVRIFGTKWFIPLLFHDTYFILV